MPTVCRRSSQSLKMEFCNTQHLSHSAFAGSVYLHERISEKVTRGLRLANPLHSWKHFLLPAALGMADRSGRPHSFSSRLSPKSPENMKLDQCWLIYKMASLMGHVCTASRSCCLQFSSRRTHIGNITRGNIPENMTHETRPAFLQDCHIVTFDLTIVYIRDFMLSLPSGINGIDS